MSATIQSVLNSAREALIDSSDSPRLDAEVLLGKVLGANRARIYANPDLPVSGEQTIAYQELVNARVAGKPVAHLTGLREFWSLELQVTSDVLVPRPETELLVERALEHIDPNSPGTLLDLGTGTGAIAVAIATERSTCNVTATDRSQIALDITAKNIATHCPGQVRIVNSNWFGALKDKHFDVIASNPPYISTEHKQRTDPELKHEPRQALYSGADGLDDLREIIAGAPKHLHPGGHLLLEHSFDQAEAVTELLKHAGFIEIDTHYDLAGHPRVTEGRLAGHG
jgi:release factor glutamine methyltransferase